MTGAPRAGRIGAISAMPRYLPRRPPTALDLSDNTNLWGPPPSTRRTLESLTDAQLSRYPTPYADELVAAIAGHHGLSPQLVTTGCGSDDVLDAAIRALVDARGSLAAAVPTFSVVPAFCEVNEVELRTVPMRPDGSVRAADLLATRADAFYVCSPNNPTGGLIDSAELRALLEGARGPVLLDEAYADFSGTSMVSLTAEFDNLLVVRTLSKSFGLAGLRVGYGIGQPALSGAVAASRGPYKVGGLSEAVAVAALREDATWATERAGEVAALRDEFAQRLRGAGFEVLDSAANFVAVLVDDATSAFEAMLAQGVLVRAYPGCAVFGDLVRITIGPAPALGLAFDALVGATS